MKKNLSKHAELVLFWGSILLSSVFIILSPYNPSLDGPAHIYNAQLINQLLSGNHFIAEYFRINPIPVPNLLDHAMLALLNIIFPVLISQKILLLFCTIGLAVSFRKLISFYNPTNLWLSAFTLPLTHSFLYYLGFYNFCLSLVFLLWVVYYYAKHFSTLQAPYKAKKIVILFILILCDYFASALTFMYLGLLLLLHEIWLVAPLVKSGQLGQNKKLILKRLLFFISLWLPVIILFIGFLTKVSFNEPAITLKPFLESLSWLYNMRPFVVYGDFEHGITRFFFWVMLFLFSGACWLIIKRKYRAETSGKGIFLASAIFSLTCFFIVPDNFSVGMMNTRFCFYFFLFFLLWLAFQQNFYLIKWTGSFTVYILYWLLFFTWHNTILKGFDGRIKQMVEASDKYIEPNKVVLPVNYTESWIMPHMVDFIAIHKPLVNLMNYEPREGWFPIVYNKSSLPYIDAIYKNDGWHVSGFNDAASKAGKQIDYLFIYGYFNPVSANTSYFVDLPENLQNRYTLIFTAEDNWIHIYKNNNSK